MNYQPSILLLALCLPGCNSDGKNPAATAFSVAPGRSVAEEQQYVAARAAAARAVPSPSAFGSHMLVPVNFGMSRAKVSQRLAEWAKLDPGYERTYNLDGHQLRSAYILRFRDNQLVQCGLLLHQDSLMPSRRYSAFMYWYLWHDVGSGYAYYWNQSRWTDKRQLGERIIEQGYPHGDTLHAARSWSWGATEIEVQRLPGVGYQILYTNLSDRRPTQQEILTDSLLLRRQAEIF